MGFTTNATNATEGGSYSYSFFNPTLAPTLAPTAHEHKDWDFSYSYATNATNATNVTNATNATEGNSSS